MTKLVEENTSISPLVRSDFTLFKELYTAERTIQFIPHLKGIEVEESFDSVLRNKSEFYFGINFNKKRVGILGVKREGTKGSELGVMLLPRKAPKGTSKYAMIQFISHLFTKTEIENVKFVVQSDNKAAILSCLSIGVDFGQELVDGVNKVGYVKKDSWTWS